MHFRKAAERLYISQPGLSRQIKQLEEELGFALFERTNRKVMLTEAGSYLKHEFSLTLKNLSKTVEHAKLLDKGEEGTINFGYVGSAMQNVIPELLVKMRKEFPNLHFGFKEMENPDQIKAIFNQDIDVGFVRLNKVPLGLNIHPVFEDTFSLVLPKDHPITTENFNSLAQLKEEEFILFEKSYSPDYYQQVMQIFDDSNFTPKIAHNTVHASTIFKLVENNFGISIVPSALKLGYKMDIKFIKLTMIPQRTILSIVWNKENRNPVLIKLLNQLVH